RAGHLDAHSRRLNASYPWGDEADHDTRPAAEGRSEDGAQLSERQRVREHRPEPAPGRRPTDPDDDEETAGDTTLQPFLTVLQDTLDVSAWDSWKADRRREAITDLARFFVRPIPGDLTAGVDVGSATVTEILFQRRNGLSDTVVLRLHLTGWNWYAQRDFILTLDAILRPAGGWGFDATGVGRVLVDLLAPELGERLSGYVFNRATPALDPTTGEAQLDPATGREILISYKELGTQLIERRLHGRGLELPFDPEVRHLLANHTYSQSGEARRFSKVNDHVVDALRVAELRKLTADWGAFTPPLIYATPAANPIDSTDILKAM